MGELLEVDRSEIVAGVVASVSAAISPLLSNIYPHEVLDKWFHEEVQPRLTGKAYLIRYADDATIVFEDESDADRVMKVLAKRLEKYGLTLHPQKTKLVAFKRPEWKAGSPRPKD